jgi:hypothetical protein
MPGREANVNKKPLVFDPVAIGATSFRREVSKRKPTQPVSETELNEQSSSRIGSRP